MLSKLILCLTLIALPSHAATFLPYPSPAVPTIPSYLELNRGQAPEKFLFLNRAGSTSITAQSILFSNYSLNLSFIASNANPQVSLSKLLPGYANNFAGSNPTKWQHAIPLHSSALLANIYPNIDANYIAGPSNSLKLQLICRPGSDPKQIAFNFDKSTQLSLSESDGVLAAKLGATTEDPMFTLQAPRAYQTSTPRVIRYVLQSTSNFAFDINGNDPTKPLFIEIELMQPPGIYVSLAVPGFFANALGFFHNLVDSLADPEGNTYFVSSRIEFPLVSLTGIRLFALSMLAPPPSDILLYKFSASGGLIWVTCLGGNDGDSARHLQLSPDGAVVLAGDTTSSDFPTTPGAFQRQPAGGDIFVTRISAATGFIIASTYLGGPNSDQLKSIHIGSDNSVFVTPEIPHGVADTGLPITRNAFPTGCIRNSCQVGYVARLSSSLDAVIYATYLPGNTLVAKLHSDNTFYFAGWASSAFPTTPDAYIERFPGRPTAFLARIDTNNAQLVFSTYIPSPDFAQIDQLAIAADGSTWATLNSFGAANSKLLHLDPTGSKLLSSTSLTASSIAVDQSGNLHALTTDRLPTSPNALLSGPCGKHYLKLNAKGETLYSTYLPPDAYAISDFTPAGNPLISGNRSDPNELNISAHGNTFLGCVVDVAYLNPYDRIVPGQIVTIFGSEFGSDLTKTRLLLNGDSLPLLYLDNWQINAVVPFSLDLEKSPKLQIEQNGRLGPTLELDFPRPALISLFLTNPASHQAAAINEDGTINSPSNPAKRGSRITLFGTGGGITLPASTAGETTPLERRPLAASVNVFLNEAFPATIEYAGAAPGLIAGITQINLKLPNQIQANPNNRSGIVSLKIVPGPRGVDFYPTIAVQP